MNNRTELKEREVEEPPKNHSKASEYIAVALCLFVILCYGVYLLQVFFLGLNYALEYSQYINQVQAISSLYLFGKLGLLVFAAVQSLILLGFVRSRKIEPKHFFYLLALIIVSNLLLYAFISYLYGYFSTLVR